MRKKFPNCRLSFECMETKDYWYSNFGKSYHIEIEFKIACLKTVYPERFRTKEFY